MFRAAITENRHIMAARSDSILEDAYEDIVDHVIEIDYYFMFRGKTFNYKRTLWDVGRRRLDVYALLRMFPKPNAERPVKNVIFHAGASHTIGLQELLICARIYSFSQHVFPYGSE